jgi:hypothetical protein
VDVNRLDRLIIIANILQCHQLIDHCLSCQKSIVAISNRPWTMPEIIQQCTIPTSTPTDTAAAATATTNTPTSTLSPTTSQSSKVTGTATRGGSVADRLMFVVDGRVYDATSFIDRHPGGKVLLQGVGTDATVTHIQPCSFL